MRKSNVDPGVGKKGLKDYKVKLKYNEAEYQKSRDFNVKVAPANGNGEYYARALEFSPYDSDGKPLARTSYEIENSETSIAAEEMEDDDPEDKLVRIRITEDGPHLDLEFDVILHQDHGQ